MRTESSTMIWLWFMISCLSSIHGLEIETGDTSEVWIFEDGLSCGGELNNTNGKLEFHASTADTVCTWVIKPNSNVFLFLEKLQLDKDDHVTIKRTNSSNATQDFESQDDLFDHFHARKDSILLITGQAEVIVELNTSSATILRHFSASYTSQSCAFHIDDDIPSLSQPIYAKNLSEPATCTYVFDFQPDILYAFHFDLFSMSKSIVDVAGVQEMVHTLTGFDLPSDMLSIGNHQAVSITVNMDPHSPNDKFVLCRDNVYEACSGQMETGALEIIQSPDMLPMFHNPKIPLECRWHLKNINSNGALRIKFESITFDDAFDVLSLIDGRHSNAVPFMQVTRFSEKYALDSELLTSSPDLLILFKPKSFASQFKAKVSISGKGHYWNNGTIRGTPLDGDENGTVFLLEVPSEQNIYVNFSAVTIGNDSVLNIYEDFNIQSRRIASIQSKVWYPIVTSTHRMMIKAVNFKSGEFEGKFTGIVPGCMYMSPIGKSDSYRLSGSCNKVCGWIIPPVKSNEDLFLHFQYVDLGKDDRIQIMKLNEARTMIASITNNATTLPQFWLSPRDGAFINISRGECPSGQEGKTILVGRSIFVPACSRNYTIPDFGSVRLTSPNYPNKYPLLMSCEFRITRASPDQIMHLSFEQFDLAPNHCINLTQVVNKIESHLQISGDVMPNDYVFTGDLVVRFVSSECGSPRSLESYDTGRGFAMNVRTTDCGGYSSLANATLTDSASKDLCIWKVTVPHNGTIKNSVNTLIYDTYDVDKFGNYKLDVYDGPSVRSQLITNDTSDAIWSRTSSLIFIYERLNSSKPSSEVQITYATKNCLPSMLCDNGICMHPDWRCDKKNDCGDYSDEHKCGYLPMPTPKDPETGISPITFGICSVVFLALGAALALIIPKLMERYNDSYYRFQPISVIE